MRKLQVPLLMVLAVLAGVASGGPQRREHPFDTPETQELLRRLRNSLYKILGKTGEEGGRNFANAKLHNKVQWEIPANIPFPCDVRGARSSRVPDSVNRLRPGDIDAIASMGDSLSAGAGIFATNVLQLTIENRGVAAAGGGQGNWRKYLTVPNIFKVFNPKLTGYALGDSLVSHVNVSRLNVAESGAISQDMPFMATFLVNRIKRDPKIDAKRHWKFISLMMGANNFCSGICYMHPPESLLDQHKKDLIETLRILRNNLPRTIVNIILPPHLKALVDTRQGRASPLCYLTTTAECPCLLALQFANKRSTYYDIIKRWQDLEQEIGNYPEFNTHDFTVNVQPALSKSVIPRAKDGFADLSYLSSDCFHISQKTNSLMANILWNNLLQPIGNKSTSWTSLLEKLLCPTPQRPYLITRDNSDLTFA